MPRDVFNPVLVTPNPLDVSDEQKEFLKAILDVSSSDSRFAIKAYLAIMKLLLGEDVTPIITLLTPDNAAAGTVAVEIEIAGQDFDSGAVVYQAGGPVPTNFESSVLLHATLNLSGASEGVLAISVRNSTGLTSNVINFTVSAPIVLLDTPFIPLSMRDDNLLDNIEDDKGRADGLTDPIANPPTQDNDYDELKKKIADFNTQDAKDEVRDNGFTPITPEPSVEDGRNVPLLNDLGSLDKVEGGK
jgi:hypothetical protein